VGIAAALTAVPSPAQAAVVGSTSSEDVVLYDECQQHPVDYTVHIPAGTTFWRLRVVIADPQGHNSQGDVFTSSTSPTSGTFTFQFCGSEDPGTYTVRATGFTEVLPAVQLPFALPDSTFEVLPARTRTALTKTRLDGRRYLLTAAVRRQSSDGFSRAEGVLTRIEQRVDGEWRPVAGTRVGTVHGLARTRLGARPGTKVRAVSAPASNYAGSTSRPVTLGG
jgi:hypothetical protein